MKIGRYKVHCLVSEYFSLDGGAMFGIVPKQVWSKRIPADAQNRIQLCSRLLHLQWVNEQGDSKAMLIDCGIGRGWPAQFNERYAVRPEFAAPLDSVVGPVDRILLTHLHFDHCAGLLRSVTEEAELVFPAAELLISRSNFFYAQRPSVREAASYPSIMLDAINKAQFSLIDSPRSVSSDIECIQCEGHTPGMLAVLISDGATTLAFAADLVPTHHHLQLPYVMGYDQCAEQSVQEKQRFLERAVRENWIVVFCHDAQIAAGRVGIDNRGKFALKEEVVLPTIDF